MVPGHSAAPAMSAPDQPAATTFPIGDWQICARTNTAARGSETRRLETRAVAVLSYLHAHRDRVVGKDELLDAVWRRTAISDHSVAVVISGLRRSLGDDSRAPRYIQTIPRRGYRLIADNDTEPALPGTVEYVPASEAPALAISAPFPWTLTWPPAWRGAALVVGGLVLLAFLVLGLMRGLEQPDSATRIATGSLTAGTSRGPFTTLEHRAVHPAFSRDGGQVAFAWNESGGFDFDLFIKPLGSETMLRLTDTDHFDTVPVWSPRGNQIAFMRRDFWSTGGKTCGVHLVSAVGGQDRRIVDCAIGARMSIDWSPDGNWIVFAQQSPDHDAMRVARVSPTSREVVPLSAPPPTSLGDDMARLSPDGRFLVFRRKLAAFINDIYVQRLDGDLNPDGPLERLTFDGHLITDIDFSADGRRVVFSSGREGLFRLWEVPVTGGTPVEKIRSSAYIYGAAISPDGKTVILDQRDEATNVTVSDLPAPGETADPADRPEPRFLIESTRFEWNPEFSPDGTQVAFVSDRTGSIELWIHAADGSNGRQVTQLGGPVVQRPRWSPDGTRIAFAAALNGNLDLYTIDTNGRSLLRHTTQDSLDNRPFWSADGRTLYFTSNRGGAFNIWSVDLATGTQRQITRTGAVFGALAPGRDHLLVSRADGSGLWRVATDGSGTESLLVEKTDYKLQGGWEVVGTDLYYMTIMENDQIAIRRRSLAEPQAEQREETVLYLSHKTYDGFFDVADDRSRVLYSRLTRYSGQLFRVDLE